MVDIAPQLCYAVASRHGVEALCERLKEVGTIEVIESVVKAIEKIAEEIPQAIIASKGLEYLAKVFEFLEVSQQVLMFCVCAQPENQKIRNEL